MAELRDRYDLDIANALKALNTLSRKASELQKKLQETTSAVTPDRKRLLAAYKRAEDDIRRQTTRIRNLTKEAIGGKLIQSGLIRRDSNRIAVVWKNTCDRVRALWRATTERVSISTRSMCNKIGTLWRSVTSLMSSRVKKVKRDYKEMADSNIEKTKRMSRRVRENTDLLMNWWKRFGEVGLGFTFIYRGVNLVENALDRFVDSMREAIQLSGEFAEIQARMAVSATLFGSNAKDFADAFKKAHANILAFRDATVGAVSTIAELGQGLDEAAQWGVIVPPKMMKPFVRFLDFINLVATTTGSAGRQIRQEIQSLFEGSKRVGNILVRLIHRLAESGAQFRRGIVEDIVAGGERAKEAFFEVVRVIGGKMEGMYKVLAEASPSYAYTVGWQKYLLNIQKLVVRATPIAKQLGFIQENAARTSNIFAVAINRAFEVVERTFGKEKFAKAVASNMVAFCQMLPRLAGLVMKAAEYINYLGVAIRNLPSGIKTIGALIGQALALTTAMWGVKSAIGLVIGIVTSAFRPFIMLATALSLTGKGAEGAAKAGSVLGLTLTRLKLKTLGLTLALTGVAIGLLVVVDNIDKVRRKLSGLAPLVDRLKESVGFLPLQIYEWYGKVFPNSRMWFEKVRGLSNRAIESVAKSAYRGGEKVSRAIGGVVEGAFKGLIDEQLKALKLAEEETWKDYQDFLRSVQENTIKLTSGLESEVDRLRTNVRSIYEEAIRSGDLSLARELVPYVKAETTLMIHALEDERRRLLKAYIGTPKEQTDLRNKIRIRLEEIRVAIRKAYASIKRLEPEFAILPSDERHYRDAIRRLRSVRDEAERLSDSYRQIVVRSKPPVERIHEWLAEQKKTIRGLGLGAKETAKLMEEATEAAGAKLRSLTEGLKNKMKDTFNAVEEFSRQAARGMMDAMSTFFFDAMVGKLKTLEDYFISFRDMVFKIIAQIAARQVAIKLGLAAVIGAKEGGIFPQGFTPIQAFAGGGIVRRPTLGLIGEGGSPEAVIPLRNGKVPVEINEREEARPIQLHINNIVDLALFGDYLSSPQGSDMIINVIARNSYQVRRILGG